MRKSIFALWVLLSPVLLQAQSFQFSQYEFTGPQVNPAWIGLTRDATVNMVFRNQRAGGDLQINSGYFAFAVPFFNRSTGKPRGGFGVTTLSDKIGPMFNNQEAAASFAVNLPVGKHQILSLGFRGLLRMQRVSIDGLFTGAQFLPGLGFSGAVNSGEGIAPLQQQYLTFSSGMLWQKTDKNGAVLRRLGFSFFDFNRPQSGFFNTGKEALPPTLVAHGSWLAYAKNAWTVAPEFLVSRSSDWNVMLAGGRLGYALNKSDRLDVLMKYAVGRSGILGVQFHRPRFSLGLSHDFPVGTGNAGNLGALEIGMEYRTAMDPKSRKSRSVQRMKKKKAAASAKRKKKSGAVVRKSTPAKTTVTTAPARQKSTQDTVRNTPVQMERTEATGRNTPVETAVPVSGDPVVREKITLHFRFNYNSTDLDEETEEYLDALGADLMRDKSLTVRLIGHTDNVGSAQLNQRLSLRRAEAVRDHLLTLGIAPERILTEGKGETVPLNGNINDEERALNRRVEILLMTKK